MEAWPNEDVGNSYYSMNVSPVGVEISMVPDRDVFFRAYDGIMLKDVGGTLVAFGVDEVEEIVIGSGGVGETKVIEIKASGMIDEK